MEPNERIDCDVAVVGGGNAGLVASLEARNSGAKVLLIEKAPKKARGGNSRLSWGLFNFVTEGVKDHQTLLDARFPKEKIEIEAFSADDFYNKIMRLSDGLSDKSLTEIFVNRSFETVMWLKAQGIDWEIDRRLAYEKDGTWVWPPGQAQVHSGGSGESLVERLYAVAEQRGIQTLYETAARSLVLNERGDICGLIARRQEGLVHVNATSIILACGGFQANPAWRRRYLGENWDLVKLRGTRYDSGDGIQMAAQAGAQLAGHWGGCHASIVSEDSPMIEAASAGSERYSYPFGIMVNRNGERFVNEGEDFYAFTYAKCGKEILKQPGSVAFQIFDAKAFPQLRIEYQDADKAESPSLAGLAGEIDIDAENFTSTIEAFNRAIPDDSPPFAPYKLDGRHTQELRPNKSNWARRIDTPPYRAYAVVCGLTMTYGGLKTNERTEVIDTSDRPIRGLYAVGEITGGFFYHNYPGGSGLIRGAVMGRIAGAQAAARAR
jgi:tricarballylate dehydrogenase